MAQVIGENYSCSGPECSPSRFPGCLQDTMIMMRRSFMCVRTEVERPSSARGSRGMADTKFYGGARLWSEAMYGIIRQAVVMTNSRDMQEASDDVLGV